MRTQLVKFMASGSGDSYEPIKTLKAPPKEQSVDFGGLQNSYASFRNTAKAHSKRLLNAIIFGAVMGMIPAQCVLVTDFTSTVTANNVTRNLMTGDRVTTASGPGIEAIGTKGVLNAPGVTDSTTGANGYGAWADAGGTISR